MSESDWQRRFGELAKAATECADDLESEISHRIPESWRKQYPSMQRRYDRDMDSVRAVRKLTTGSI